MFCCLAQNDFLKNITARFHKSFPLVLMVSADVDPKIFEKKKEKATLDSSKRTFY